MAAKCDVGSDVDGMGDSGGMLGCRYSGSGRVGGTGAAGTAWTSETSVACSVGAGWEGSLTVAMSGGGRAGSMTEGATYDVGTGTGGMVGNEGRTGGGIVSVRGAGFGTSR